jgi:pimeloyl-ACP methyl ester carboxylesterase
MGRHRLDHFRRGTGEPIVLLHGMFQSWHSWAPLLDRLIAERDVFAPTHLGHAGSAPFEVGHRPTINAWTDAIEAELDEAGFDQPDIVGHSLGGWVAMELAKRGRARSIVAISPAGQYSDEDVAKIAARVRRYGMARSLLPLVRRVARTTAGRKVLFADSCSDPGRIRPEEAERLVVDFAACRDPQAFVGALKDQTGKAIRIREPERVRCPVLILAPERDRFFLHAHAERYVAALPQAISEVLPDCGHSAMFDGPELIGSKVLTFTAAFAADAEGDSPDPETVAHPDDRGLSPDLPSARR